MHVQFREGSFYAADGSLVAGPDDLPLTISDLEVVYDSSAEGNHYAWIWDAATDDAGNPVVAYATFPSTLAHEYRYARWDGRRWHDHHLTDAGRYVARRPIELHYSGGSRWIGTTRASSTAVSGGANGASSGGSRRPPAARRGRSWR
ncbi:BNR-4 repeat-containing protein [Halalkalicoccus salilacus]|uniref:BNR-4 repeat-containing protein n=1 Tax=Halalkalicoccus sp. GCM10025704 TaxID=3252662 RepID=UPI00360F6FF4